MNEYIYEKSKLNESLDLKNLITIGYEIYNKIKNLKIKIRGKNLFFKTELDVHTMKELGYEHIISMKNNMGLRIYEKNRIIYMPILEKILFSCINKCSSIKFFYDNKDICIWCPTQDYLIVLANRKNGYLLKTAYPIIYKHKREAIEKKANENGI